MPPVTYTHKGWFLLCPVYVAMPHTETPSITPRWGWADAIMVLQALACDAVDLAMNQFGRELVVPIFLLSEMDRPVTVNHTFDVHDHA